MLGGALSPVMTRLFFFGASRQGCLVVDALVSRRGTFPKLPTTLPGLAILLTQSTLVSNSYMYYCTYIITSHAAYEDAYAASPLPMYNFAESYGLDHGRPKARPRKAHVSCPTSPSSGVSGPDPMASRDRGVSGRASEVQTPEQPEAPMSAFGTLQHDTQTR